MGGLQEERAELKAANHRLVKEKALLQLNVQDQQHSSDEREDSSRAQVTLLLLCIYSVELFWSLSIPAVEYSATERHIGTVTCF